MLNEIVFQWFHITLNHIASSFSGLTFLHCLSDVAVSCFFSSYLGFGPQWKPSAINSTQEFQDLFEGHKQLSDTQTFFVYGSTIQPNGTVISQDDYRLDRLGETKWVWSVRAFLYTLFNHTARTGSDGSFTLHGTGTGHSLYRSYGSYTLHRTVPEIGTGTGMGTIENSSFLPLSLCRVYST